MYRTPNGGCPDAINLYRRLRPFCAVGPFQACTSSALAHNADRPFFSTPLTLFFLAGQSALVVDRSGDVLRWGKPNASQQVDLSDIFDSFFGGGGGMGGGGGRQQQRRQGPVRGTPFNGNPTMRKPSVQNQIGSVKLGCMVFGSILSYYYRTAPRNDRNLLLPLAREGSTEVVEFGRSEARLPSLPSADFVAIAMYQVFVVIIVPYLLEQECRIVFVTAAFWWREGAGTLLLRFIDVTTDGGA